MTTPLTDQYIGMNTFQTYLNNKVDGTPLSAGVVKFFSDINRTTLKTVYQISGSPPNYNVVAITNPNTLNIDGTLSGAAGSRVIHYFYPYDADGNIELYYIEVYDQNSVLQETLEGFPPNVFNEAGTITADILNYITNPQLLLWDYTPVTFGSGSPLSGTTVVTSTGSIVADDTQQLIVDGWYFQRNASTTTDNFSQQQFATGQVAVEGNPLYYLLYTCSAATGETYKWIVPQINYNNVNFLQGQTVTLSSWAIASANTRKIEIKWYQDFGAGGSPVQTSATLATINLTTSWAKYTVNFTVPSTLTFTALPNTLNYCAVILSLDINVACTYGFSNAILKPGLVADPPVIPLSYAQYKAAMDFWFKITTGTYQFFAPSSVTQLDMYGWLPLIDSETLGNGGSGGTHVGLYYYNLYVFFYTSYSDAVCPVSTGRGADAIADWNAGKKLQVPTTNSRLLGASGSGAGLTARAAGATGGGENVLKPHTHTFGTNKNIPGITGSWVNDGALDGGAVNIPVIPGGFPGTGPSNISATDSAGSGTDTMNPFTFLQLYVHV